MGEVSRRRICQVGTLTELKRPTKDEENWVRPTIERSSCEVGLSNERSMTWLVDRPSCMAVSDWTRYFSRANLESDLASKHQAHLTEPNCMDGRTIPSRPWQELGDYVDEILSSGSQ
jgi:hypothetical protein